MRLVECVPNFSEGRNPAVIDAIAAAIKDTEGAWLLDVDPGKETNRTVVTFVADYDAAVRAAFNAIETASRLIDMRKHTGAHPRMGATDVCPFVPVRGVTMEDCAALARELGKRVGEELRIPVYLYENAAATEERKNLANVRAGEYEGLAKKLADPRVEARLRPGGVQREIRRDGDRRAGVPHRLQRKPQHQGPEARQRRRALDPRGRTRQAR